MKKWSSWAEAETGAMLLIESEPVDERGIHTVRWSELVVILGDCERQVL